MQGMNGGQEGLNQENQNLGLTPQNSYKCSNKKSDVSKGWKGAVGDAGPHPSVIPKKF